MEKTIDSNVEKNEGLFRRLYNVILKGCESKAAPWILGVLSFTESCCFIIPPEVMMLPMGYANRKRVFHYALITTVASVLGAVAGYYMGALAWDILQPFLFSYVPGFESYFDVVKMKYADNATLALFVAAFTPIPFKVFTVGAGVFSDQVSIILLIGASFVGRGARYFMLSGLVYFLGARAKKIIEKYFMKFTILVGILVIILALLSKLQH
ncbi:MAG: DedA family protein [Bacteriovoracaceae bacterium]|nr:DedA family protein [Bacteriovoracaceae bacterium]